jgi:hypothetical protein
MLLYTEAFAGIALQCLPTRDGLVLMKQLNRKAKGQHGSLAAAWTDVTAFGGISCGPLRLFRVQLVFSYCFFGITCAPATIKLPVFFVGQPCASFFSVVNVSSLLVLERYRSRIVKACSILKIDIRCRL